MTQGCMNEKPFKILWQENSKIYEDLLEILQRLLTFISCYCTCCKRCKYCFVSLTMWSITSREKYMRILLYTFANLLVTFLFLVLRLMPFHAFLWLVKKSFVRQRAQKTQSFAINLHRDLRIKTKSSCPIDLLEIWPPLISINLFS